MNDVNHVWIPDEEDGNGPEVRIVKPPSEGPAPEVVAADGHGVEA